MASDEREVEAVAAALWGLPSDLPRDVLTSARAAIAALDAHRAKVGVDKTTADKLMLDNIEESVITAYLAHKAAQHGEGK